MQKTIDNLTENEYTKKGQIDLYGFIHPEICLISIEEGLLPDIIIYDWEYGNSLPNQSSGDLLLEILEKTSAFIFVYSGMSNSIPPTLNESKFNAFADRFQLLAKGNTSHLIFSSEEFIYQYIISRINKNNIIKIHGIDIEFKSNGYLKMPTDILYLEQIFGRQFVLEQIKRSKSIDEGMIESILLSISDIIYFNESKGILASTENKGLIENNNLVTLTYAEVVKKFDIQVLEEILEKGLFKI